MLHDTLDFLNGPGAGAVKTFLACFTAIILAWLALRTKTAKIWQEEAAANAVKAARLSEELAAAQKQIAKLELDKTTLQARTDLTELMKLQQESTKSLQKTMGEMQTANAKTSSKMIEVLQIIVEKLHSGSGSDAERKRISGEIQIT